MPKGPVVNHRKPTREVETSRGPDPAPPGEQIVPQAQGFVSAARDAAFDYTPYVMETVGDGLVVLDSKLVVQSANSAFYRMFRSSPTDTEQCFIYSLGNGHWNIPELRRLLEEVLPLTREIHNYEVEAVFPNIGPKIMCLNARRFAITAGQKELILLAITDVTEKTRLQQEVAEKARLLDLSNDAIMLRDRDDKITLWNKGAEKLFGWKASEVMGKNLHLLMQTQFPKPFEDIIEQLHREGHFRGEVTQTAKDGRRIPSLCRWVLDPQTQSILTSHTDMTERKRVEDEQSRDLADARELQRISAQLIHEDNVKLLYDDIVAATIAVMRSDAGTLQLFDRDRGELRLLAGQGLEPESARALERVRLDSTSACGIVLCTGKRLIVPDLEEPNPLLDSDDLIAYRNSGLQAVQSTPLVARSGKVVGMISTYWRKPHTPQPRELGVLDILARQAADVLERRQQEGLLRRSEASQRLVFETVEEFFIFSTDSTGLVTDWNPGAKRIFGYAAHEMMGQDAAILFTPEDRANGVPEQEMETARHKGFALDERWHLRKNNERFFASGAVRPLRGDTGKLLGFVKVGRDVTERKRNEETLQRAQVQLSNYASELEKTVSERTARLQELVQELESYSYSIAHDMRAPLRAMSSFARLVQTEHSDQLDSAGRDYVERIIGAAQRLDRLVTDVLNYSSVSRRDISLAPVDLESLVKEAIHNRPDFQPPDATVEIQGPLYEVTAHEPSLMQAVSNLLSNAVKFVSPGVSPHVTVRSEIKGQEVRLWFEDNGIGIATKDLETIFALFGRLHPAAEFEGTGIGLSIVRKAIERMGGSVGVESELGKGSRFWIQLRNARAGPSRQ